MATYYLRTAGVTGSDDLDIPAQATKAFSQWRLGGISGTFASGPPGGGDDVVGPTNVSVPGMMGHLSVKTWTVPGSGQLGFNAGDSFINGILTIGTIVIQGSQNLGVVPSFSFNPFDPGDPDAQSSFAILNVTETPIGVAESVGSIENAETIGAKYTANMNKYAVEVLSGAVINAATIATSGADHLNVLVQGGTLNVSDKLNDYQTVLITQAGTATINGEMDPAADSKTGPWTNTITVTGAGSRFVVNSEFTVGGGSAPTGTQGTLIIQAGATGELNRDVTVGDHVTDNGQITVTGKGSTLRVIGDLTAGNEGQGNLTVAAGGALTINGDLKEGAKTGSVLGSGATTITGGDTTMTIHGGWQIGVKTARADTVGNGATVNIDGELQLGVEEGGDGSLDVSGATTSLIISAANAEVTIGADGVGKLRLSQGTFFDAAASDVTVGDKSGEGPSRLDIDAATMAAGNLTIGGGGFGALTMENGAALTVQSDLSLGDESGSKYSAAIQFSTLSVGGSLTVGGAGKPAATPGFGDQFGPGGNMLLNAASVSVGSVTLGDEAEGKGTLTLNLSNLTSAGDMTIGGGGSGTMLVQLSSKVTAGKISLGEEFGGTGSMTIDNSFVFGDDLTVGSHGKGTLKVVDGGVLFTNGDASIGDQVVANIQAATVTASLWNISGDLQVGEAGIGQMTVQSGGSVQVGNNVVVADLTGSGGILTIKGSGSATPGSASGAATNPLNSAVLRWADTLTVGGLGVGTLAVTGGGLVAAVAGGVGAVEIAAGVGSVGKLSLSGGSSLSASDVSVGGTDKDEGGTGTLTAGKGDTIRIADAMNLWSGGTVSVGGGGAVTIGDGALAKSAVSIGGTGTLTGAGTIAGALKNAGIVDVKGGTLVLKSGALTGSGGVTIESDGVLDLSAAKSGDNIATLTDDGALVLGSNTLTVTGSYSNANWGSGDLFDPTANVTGGSIIGKGAALKVLGDDVTKTKSGLVLHFSAIAGGLQQASFALENSGTGAAVTAALQTAGLGFDVSGVAAGNVTLSAGQSSGEYTLTYDPSGGSLSGQTLKIVSDFANVAPITLSLAAATPLVVSKVSTDHTGEAEPGDNVAITVSLSAPVTVDTSGGSPDLELSSGGVAHYNAEASNPGVGSLVFDYLVATGDSASGLTIAAVDLAGAGIRDTGGDDADLSGAVNAPLGLKIGAAQVSVVTATGAVAVGDTVAVTLTLTSGVTVDSSGGMPSVTLNSGGTASYDAAASSPGAGNLVFDYVVGAGDQSPDLEVASVSLNGGSVRDGFGVAADFSAAATLDTGVRIGASPLTVAAVALSATGALQAGTIAITLTMSEPVSVDTSNGLPALSLNDGGVAYYDTDSSDPASGTLVFDYVITPGDWSPALAVTAVDLNGATLRDATGYDADFSGVVGPLAGVSVGVTGVAFVTDTSSTSHPATGDLIAITLNLNRGAVVTGAPRLTLSDGALAVYDTAASAPASGRLTFDYTPAAGDHTTDLRVAGLDFNGGTIVDNDGHGVDPSGAVADLGLDVNAVFVNAASASPAGGTIGVGQTVHVTLNMSNSVTVTGAPSLVLNDGATAAYNAGASDPAHGVLVFDHVVAAENTSPDLTIASVALNGGAINDASGHAADLSVAAHAALGLRIGAPLTVTKVTPSAAGELDAGQLVALTLTMSESVTVTGTPTLSLNDGGVALYDAVASNPSAGMLVFDDTIGTAESTPNLAILAVNLPSSASVQDAAGFNADFSNALNVPTGLAIGASSVTSVTASVSGFAAPGTPVRLTLHMSAPVTVAGTPSLALSNGGAASYDAALSTATGLVFDYTVGASDQQALNVQVTAVVLSAGASITETGSGGAANLAGVTNLPTGVQTASPLAVDSVAAEVASVVLRTGDTLTVSVTLLEDGTIDTTGGLPTLTLNDGGTAVYNGDTGDVSTLEFLYTVGSTDTTPDLKVTGINLNGATLVDALGFEADFSGVPNADLALPVNPLPLVTSLVVNNGNVAVAGDEFFIVLDTNIPVQVTGTPRLILNDGGTATFVSVSSFNFSQITFDYTVAAGEQTTDLEITGVDLTGASVRTASGTDLDFSSAINASTGQQISAPLSISAITVNPTSGEVDGGGTVQLGLQFNEPVVLDTGKGTPTIDLSLTAGHQFDVVLTPTQTAVATYDPLASNLSTGLLIFDYTASASDETSNLTLADLNLNGASLHDAAGFHLANLFNGTIGLGFQTGLQIGPVFVNSGFNLVNSGLEAEVNAGQTIQLVLEMSDPVTITGSPSIALNNGAVATYDPAGFFGIPSDIVFDYTVGPNDNIGSLLLAGVSLPAGSSIKDASGVPADFTAAAGTQFFVQVGPDTVTGVSTNFDNAGTAFAGETVHVTLTVQNFNLSLSGGVPTMTLSNGGTATYDSGLSRLNNSGDNQLVFDYVVGASDPTTNDLRVAGVTLNGAVFKDASGNVADLSGATNIDTLLRIVAPPPSGAEIPTDYVFAYPPGYTSPDPLISGQTIEFGFYYVTVSGGMPTITLNDGGVATYDAGASTSSTAVFDYTVGPGDHVATLDISAFHANGATFTNPFGNDGVDFSQATLADLDLQVGASPLTVSSLKSSASVVARGETVQLTASLNEPVTINNPPSLALNDGGIASYDSAASNPSAGVLVFDHVVGATDQALDLMVTGVNQDDTPGPQDSAGYSPDYTGLLNVGVGTEITPLRVAVVTASPGAPIIAGETVHVTIVMNEPVFVNGSAPSLTLNDGGTANYDAGTSQPSSGRLVFDTVVGQANQTADLAVTGVTLPPGTTIRDASGFDAALTGALNVPTGTRIGASPLVVTHVAVSAGTPEPQSGATVTLTLTMSEAAIVDTTNGAPTLSLNDGGSAEYDAVASNPGTGSLIFSYIVGTTEHTPDLRIAAVHLNGASVRDAGGAGADFSAALDVPTGLPIGPAVVTSVQSLETEVDTGGIAHVALYLSQGITVTGTPLLMLNDGATASYDAGASAPASGLLLFDSAVTSGNATPDLTITGLQFPGLATVQDANGVSADLSGAIGQGTGLGVNQVACFAAGTRIATSRDEVAVEALAVGDLVRTHDGRWEKAIWVGSRTLDCARHPSPLTVWPIRVAAGAFGGGVPARDLYLSPDHAVFVNEVLVPVRLLVNGTTITQVKRDRVRYFHVELPRHEVILAEGLTVESYLDVGDRADFAGGDRIRLFPDFSGTPDAALIWETRAAARLVMTGKELDTAKRVVAAKASRGDAQRASVAA